MYESQQRKGTFALWAGLLAAALLAGCGAITVHHVPELQSISSDKIPDLRGSRSLDVRSGPTSAEEVEIGTVGVGKVVGSLRDWTNATVTFVKAELSERGATISESAPRFLTLTVTKAEVSAVPLVGISTGKVSLMVVAADGHSGEFEGTSSSLAPLGAINGAATDAVKIMLEDPKIGAYLRQ